MTWTEFASETALDRDVLVRALPLVHLMAGPSPDTAVLNVAANTAQVSVLVTESLGATPSSCVDLLRLRPLLVGAAWRVLDLLLEEALEAAGEVPDLRQGTRWSIHEKVSKAGSRAGRPSWIPSVSWDAALACYVETHQLRHSLVHRTVHTDSANSLIGYDEQGKALRTMTTDEQEAFGRMVMRLSELALQGAPNLRILADLDAQMARLSGVHGTPHAAVKSVVPVTVLKVILDPNDAGLYEIDVDWLRQRHPFQGSQFVDLVVTFRDRPGAELRGQLEDALSGIHALDPLVPPSWLS